MKILFTGGGSGGHFYPIIAVAEAINKISGEKHLLESKLYYLSPVPYDEEMLLQNGIRFIKVPAGKIRRYFSLLNVLDFFKTLFGLVGAVWQIYKIFPDIVFSKGAYASFPTLFAARLFGIPVVIHESDSVPGKVNLWASKFAKKIAISYPNAINYFPKEKTALTGNPIREEMIIPQKNGAYEFLKLEDNIPVILILGGSQGARNINDATISILPKLLEKYQVIHQIGSKEFDGVTGIARIVLKDSQHKERYRPFPYLNDLAMKMSAGVSELVISRAGSAIFEIAVWGIPSIIIPIADSNGDHQRKNAFTYAEAEACVVIEEKNLSQNLVLSEIEKLMTNKNKRDKMSIAAKSFARVDAARKIADEIIRVGLKHE